MSCSALVFVQSGFAIDAEWPRCRRVQHRNCLDAFRRQNPEILVLCLASPGSSPRWNKNIRASVFNQSVAIVFYYQLRYGKNVFWFKFLNAASLPLLHIKRKSHVLLHSKRANEENWVAGGPISSCLMNKGLWFRTGKGAVCSFRIYVRLEFVAWKEFHSFRVHL